MADVRFSAAVDSVVGCNSMCERGAGEILTKVVRNSREFYPNWSDSSFDRNALHPRLVESGGLVDAISDDWPRNVPRPSNVVLSGGSG